VITLKTPQETAKMREAGRIVAEMLAACRSAVLVMMLTWLAPSCLIEEVTWRNRLTTFSSICLIIWASRKCTLRM